MMDKFKLIIPCWRTERETAFADMYHDSESNRSKELRTSYLQISTTKWMTMISTNTSIPYKFTGYKPLQPGDLNQVWCWQVQRH